MKKLGPYQKTIGYIAGSVFAIVFAVLGIHLLLHSHAANTTASAAPTSPPVQICGNSSELSGPSTQPAGSTPVPAGDNSGFTFNKADTTYWFEPGEHYLSPAGATWDGGNYAYNQIIPADGDTYIGAPGAILDGQTVNEFAFTQGATNVTIEYLTIQNFGTNAGNGPYNATTNPYGDDQNNNQGVINHDSGSNWTIEHNTVQDNAGAGVFMGTNDVIEYNCLTKNGQYGFSSYLPSPGPSNITLSDNEVSYNDAYNWEVVDLGCGCSGGGKFWETNGATITDNYVHDNENVGIWADTDNQNFNISGNYIANNYGEGVMYEISYNGNITNNTFVGNANGEGPTNSGFPTGALYISESGSDSRVAGAYSGGFTVSGNVFTNNWSGVILWENSNRFCGNLSPDNAGTLCTLVAPSVATSTTCDNSTNIQSSPLYWDCRWRTQNITVSDNTFNVNPADIGSDCTEANSCGFNGVFSEYGETAPYTAWPIATSIVQSQNNVFSDNTYNGPWNFMTPDQGVPVDWSDWTSGFTDNQDGSGIKVPAQDAGSTYCSNPSGTNCNTTPPPAILPTVPTNVVATATGDNSVKVTWGGSTDSGGPGLCGYDIYRDGTEIGSTEANSTCSPTTTTYPDDSVSSDTTYTYQVDAFDTGNNASALSSAATVKTPGGGGTGGGTVEDKTFEDGTDNMTPWYDDTVAQSNAQAHGGSYSLAVTGTGGNWGVEENWPGAGQVTAGTSYAFTAWARAATKAEPITYEVTWIGADSSAISNSTIATTTDNSTGWTELSGTASAPSGATNVDISFVAPGPSSSGEVHYLDDVEVTSSGSTSNPNPTTPTNLKVSGSSPSSVSLGWTASTDTGGTLGGYYVIRNGATIATVLAPATIYNDQSVASSTTYSYQVESFDTPSGVISQPTAAISVTTPACTGTGPTKPTGLTANVLDTSQVNLSWTASTDGNCSVSYRVYRDSKKVGSNIRTTTYGDTGLNASTTYQYYIVAFDKAGNVSQASDTVSATTDATSSFVTIQGVVTTNTADPQPMGNVTVSTGNVATPGGMTSTGTNSQGQYTLVNIKPGNRNIYWSALNYTTLHINKDFSAGVTTKNVKLSLQSQ